MLHEQRIISSDDAPTLADLFNERCMRSPNGLAYLQYRDGGWQEYSWEATRAAVARWQAAMLAEEAAKTDAKTFATIAPNYAYGKDAEGARAAAVDRLKSASDRLSRAAAGL